MLMFCPSLYVLGIIGMFWSLIFHVKESDYFNEENTIAPHHVEEEAVVEGQITQEQLERELRKEKIAAGNAASDNPSESAPQESFSKVTPVPKL